MSYLLQRLAFYLFTLWAAVTVNFFVPRLVPGDPVLALLSRYSGQVDPGSIASLRVLFGLNQHVSLLRQYGSYLVRLLHGDLGVSFTYFPTPVSTVLAQSLPWTLALVGVTTVVGFLLGTALGAFAAWRRGSWADLLVPVGTFCSSIPYFWLGIIAITLFTGPDSVLPASGGFSPGLVPGWHIAFVGSAIRHGFLPALTILVSSASGWMLTMRNTTIAVATEDYVTAAYAKGLPERRVLLSYAVRNALLPNVASFALSLGFVVSGTLLMEIVFSYPGVGYQLFQAVGAEDYPLMQGIFLVVTLSVLAANLLADVAYVVLDPRTRREA